MNIDTELVEAGSVISGEVTVSFDVKKVKNWEKNFAVGLLDMAADIRNNAVHRAPYQTGALSNSIRFGTPTNVQQVKYASASSMLGLATPEDVINEGEIQIVAGGVSAPMSQIAITPSGQQVKAGKGMRFVNYAAIREKGPNRNPATEHYMENALKDAQAPGWEKKYFGGVIK